MNEMNRTPLLEVRDLVVRYPIRGLSKREIHAVDCVSFTVHRGETLGLVGESGCGKTTVARQIVALERPTAGQVLFDGTDISTLRERELRALRPRIQMVFQDNDSSLNPRRRVRELLCAPMLYHGLVDRKDGAALERRLGELMDMVELPREALDRYPHQFSGGQRQRIGIAKALSLAPQLLVCDEPVSALDVSIQAQILQLLRSLQRDLGLSMLFIGHGLPTVRYISDRVAVMYMGQLVELAPSDALFDRPLHPYTRALCNAVPLADPTARDFTAHVLGGEVGSNMTPPTGCRFHPRCPVARECCKDMSLNVSLHTVEDGHSVACPYAQERGG
ncbi:MAG: ATP-binding cassette domain-containing protein [Clostridia bacterium]|nr:ATP-binding cassette domain-containing protein [Clostridia bacterium]